MQTKQPKPASKARNSRSRRCYYCERRFKNSQAVRGHQLHCPVRRLKEQAEAKNDGEPHRGAAKRERVEPLRPEPDSKDSKLLLLDTHEAILNLLGVLEHIGVSAHFFFRSASAHISGNTTPREWAKLYIDLDYVERDFAEMMARLRLDRALLFAIYHRLVAIRSDWLRYRDHDHLQETQRRQLPTGEDSGSYDMLLPKAQLMSNQEKDQFDDLISKVKRLVVSAH